MLGYKHLNESVHGPLCRRLGDPKVDSQLYLLPRGHLKSSIVAIGFPLWLLVRNPNLRIGIFNYSERLVIKFLRTIRMHMESNPIFREYWGDLVPDQPEIWNQNEVLVNRDLVDPTPSLSAMSILENTTGSHHDVHIYDDLVCARSVETLEAIERLHNSFIDMGAILNPPRPGDDPYIGFRVMIGTRWHFADEYQRILDDDNSAWTVMRRQAIENGEIIFPELITKELLDRKRSEMGSFHFSSQFFNEPVDSDKALFPPSLIRRFRHDALRWLERTGCQTYMAIDPAWSTEGSDDHWGIIVGAMTQDQRAWILDCMATDGRDHRKQSQKEDYNQSLFANIALMIKKYRVTTVGFEAVGGQKYLLRELRQACEEMGIDTHFVPLSHHSIKKEVRILSLQPHFENGRVIIHDQCDDLVMQLIRYPRARYKDLIDALEMFMRIAKPSKHVNDLAALSERGTAMYEMKQMIKRNRRKKQGFAYAKKVS